MPSSNLELWKILVVDDDRDIHALTKILFSDLEFQGRGIQFLYAESAAVAQKMMDEMGSRIAIVLLDMVMGDRNAGIKVIDHVRKINLNLKTRFIVRTAVQETQPSGSFMKDFDIDCSVLKSELTVPDFREKMLQALGRYESKLTANIPEKEFLNSIILQMRALKADHLSPIGKEKVEVIVNALEEYYHGVLG